MVVLKHYYEYSNNKVDVVDFEIDGKYEFNNIVEANKFFESEFYTDLFTTLSDKEKVSVWCASEGDFEWYRSKIIIQ